MSTLSTHVLDTSLGTPAAGVTIVLERQRQSEWTEVSKGITDTDGRVKDFIPAGTALEKGMYRMRFGSGDYFRASGRKCFYPIIEVVFELGEKAAHTHVPLLLSPYGYSTYRGS